MSYLTQSERYQIRQANRHVYAQARPEAQRRARREFAAVIAAGCNGHGACYHCIARLQYCVVHGIRPPDGGWCDVKPKNT